MPVLVPSFERNPSTTISVPAGSEFFVVYTDERDTSTPGYPGLRNKAFVVKINRLFRF